MGDKTLGVRAVGGDEAGYGEDDELAMREYVMTLPRSLHEHADDFARLRMTAEAVGVFVATARRSGHAWWKNGVDEECAADVRACAGQESSIKAAICGAEHITHLRVKLSEAQRAKLKTEYASITELSFEPPGRGEPVEHAMANAARVIANVQIRRMIPRGHRVLEVGAKLDHVVAFGPEIGTYMACMPILDSHDVMRHSSSESRVRIMMQRDGRGSLKGRQRAVAETYFSRFTEMFTRQVIQDVTWQTDCIISIDANYDIPMRDMPKIMHRTGARAWFGSMVRCPEAVLYAGKVSGYLPLTEFEYIVDADRDQISFNFRSASRPYRHRLSTYRDYMAYTTRTFRYAGKKYVYTVLPMTVSSQTYFAMNEVPDRPYEEDNQQFLPTGRGGMLRVEGVSAVLSAGGRSRCESAPFEVPEEHMSRMLQERMLLPADAPDHQVFTLVRAARVGFVVNGVKLKYDSPLAVSLAKTMVGVLNAMAKEMHANGKSDTKSVMRLMRSGGMEHFGLVGTLKNMAWQAVAGPGTLVSLVQARVSELAHDLGGGVKVVRLPHYVSSVREVVDLGRPDGDVIEQWHGGCVCTELAQARRMFAGHCGGLSQDETVVLAKYINVLRRRICSRCSVDWSDLMSADVDSEVKDTIVEDESGKDTSDSGVCLSYDDAHDEDLFFDASSGSATSASASDDEHADEEIERFAGAEVAGGQGCEVMQEGAARDAVEEYVEILSKQMSAADSSAEKWARVLLSAGLDSKLLVGASDIRLAHAVLKVEQGLVVGFYGECDDPQAYNRVYDYDQQKFYNVQRLPNGAALLPRRCSSLVYTHSGYLIWNQPSLKNAAFRVLYKPEFGEFKQRLRFVNGVFGCGKTTEILNQYTAGDMYLSATRASVRMVRRKLYGNEKNGRLGALTYDSASIHGVDRDIGTLYMDELPMVHFGQILMLLDKLKFQRVVAYGDFFQIPYIPFLADYKARFSSAREFCDFEMRAITHRCRLDICAAVLSFYGERSGLGVCNCCAHICASEESFSVENISSLSQVPVHRGVKYLTFTQKEKDEVQGHLVTHGSTEVEQAELVEVASDTTAASTVHEMQGGTVDRVYIVRTNVGTRPDSVYFSEPHVLVALTRARIEVRYFTASREIDLVRKCHERSCDERLRQIIRENSGKAPLSAL